MVFIGELLQYNGNNQIIQRLVVCGSYDFELLCDEMVTKLGNLTQSEVEPMFEVPNEGVAWYKSYSRFGSLWCAKVEPLEMI